MSKLRNVRTRQHDAWARREVKAGRGTSLMPPSAIRNHNRIAHRANHRIHLANRKEQNE